jgi:ubiquinone biosynthesis protein COQ4
MVSWNKVRELMRARRAGAPLGDLAVIKFDMIGGSPPDINARLRASGNHGCLEVDMNELRGLPDGAVGREYARHLDKNGLSPLVVSAEIKERFAQNPYALRYTTTHDLFHVLTGFPTTPAGEIGLLAFMVAQGFAGGSKGRLWASALSNILFMPLHTPGVLHNLKVGFAMGKAAKNLLEEPVEAYLREPVDAARKRVGLPDPRTAGIAPGHDSLLAKWLLPKPAALPA